MSTQPNAGDGQRLEWAEVESLARDIFSVFVGQPELHWAKRAWGALEKAGLTAYRDEVERYPVTFRLLVLGGIYLDFCEMAFDESSEIEYTYWFEIEGFVAGQLWGRCRWKFADDLDDSEVLNELVEAHRDEVVKALLHEFGGVSGLYESLWRSKDEPTDGRPLQAVPDDGAVVAGQDEEDVEEEDPDDDTFLPYADECQAYEWVSGGCQRVH